MTRYRDIASEFGYDTRKDQAAAIILNDMLEVDPPLDSLSGLVCDRIVFCVGAGPSLDSWIPVLRNHPDVTCIAADSATLPLLENGVAPHIVITDLDGDMECLNHFRNSAIYVVHAHGDNVPALPMVERFPSCMGTTQNEPVGKVYNIGGFTDGDRAVFLAHHFGARAAIMLGMDLGGPVSLRSTNNPEIKLKKLGIAAKLLEWLATFSGTSLYTASCPITGVNSVSSFHEMERILTG